MAGYSPLTPDETIKALAAIGVQSIDDLFSPIPPKIRENGKIDFGQDLSPALTEHELRTYFKGLSDKNASDFTHFLGGGIYDNIFPALLDQIVSRGEYLTCYTPYQPEISQGTLQVIFEFQTLIARITGLEVSNASLYDGATATAEAVLMAQRIARKNDAKMLIASTLAPDYKSVIDTFLGCYAPKPERVPANENGTLDLDALKEIVAKEEPAALVVGYPNYLGIVEPLDEIRKAIPESCLLVAAASDLSALSIFEAPGKMGADIVTGEAQQLGTPMLGGGPHVGILSTRKKFLRQLPGRIVGETKDTNGNRAYTLTLATREQHIRREKATSNICTNQGLIALRTTIYLSFLGKEGFKELGQRNHSLFSYLKSELESHGIPARFKEAQHYREAVFEVPNLDKRFQTALDESIIPGIRLGQKFSNSAELADSLLIAVHPKHTKANIDKLVEVLSRG